MTSQIPLSAPGHLTGTLADLVAHAVTSLGYVPWHSLCLVGLDEHARHRGVVLGPVARLDAACVPAAELGARLREVGGALHRAGCTGLAVVVLGAPPAEARPLPEAAAAARAVLGAARRALGQDAPSPAASLVVEGERWRHVDCPGPTGGPAAAHRCCPPRGRTMAEVRSSRAWTCHVLAGHVVVGSRADLGVGTCAVPGCVARAGRAVRGAVGEHGRVPHDPVVLWGREVAARVGVRTAGSPAPACDPELLGALAAALEDRTLRDAALAWAATGVWDEGETGAGADAAAGALAGYLEPAALTRALDLAGPPGPLAAGTIDLLEAIAAHTTGPVRVSSLASLGYLLWWTGQGARADVVTRQALGIDPDHTLATLVRQVLDGCLPPPWVAGRGEVVGR